MYIHTYVRTYVRTYVHTHTHTPTSTTHQSIHTYMHVCIHSCMYTHIHTTIHKSMHTYIHAHIHTYIRSHLSMHAYWRARLHSHVHANTCMHPCMCMRVHTGMGNSNSMLEHEKHNTNMPASEYQNQRSDLVPAVQILCVIPWACNHGGRSAACIDPNQSSAVPAALHQTHVPDGLNECLSAWCNSAARPAKPAGSGVRHAFA